MIWLNIVAIGVVVVGDVVVDDVVDDVVVVVGDVSIEMRSFWTKLWWLGPTATMENNLDRKNKFSLFPKVARTFLEPKTTFRAKEQKPLQDPIL